MWVLEQVADLVIDLERPVIVEEIGIKPFHSHLNIVLQLTTDDYGSCLLVVQFVTQARSVSGKVGRLPARRWGSSSGLVGPSDGGVIPR
jgi:hypothetical protein